MTQWQDDISAAEEITVSDVVHLGPQDLTGFTSNTGSSDPTYTHTNQSGWLKVTFYSTATNVQFDTIGSNYDTMLAIYSGTPGSLVHIASDDDAGGAGTSKFTVTINPGTYYLMVSAYSSTLNPTYFNITSPSFPLHPPQAPASTQAFIDSPIKINFAYTQADIRVFDSPRYGQTQAWIKKGAGYANAQAWISISPYNSYAYRVKQDGAISFWPMDGPKSSGPQDIIGNYKLVAAYDSYFNQASVYAGINPPYRQAHSFYYYYGYLYSPTPSRFQGSQWTFEGWVQFYTGYGTSSKAPIFSIGSTVVVGQGGTTPNSLGNYVTTMWGSTVYNSNVVVDAGNGWSSWYYLALTYDNGTVTFYVNGVQTNQWNGFSVAGNYFYLDYSPYQGADIYQNYYPIYDGISAYDTVLTPAQITDHYIAGKLQAYAQAKFLIRWSGGFAQASWYGGPYKYITNPNPPFDQIPVYAWNQQSLALAQLQAFNIPQVAQARVKVIYKDIPKSAQAQAVLNPSYAPTPNMGLYVNQDNASYWVQAASGWPNFPSQNIHSNSQWWITGSFTADVSGTWQFQLLSDYHAILYIDGVSTIDVWYNGGTVATSTIFNAGDHHTITLWWQGDGAPNALIAQYKRPADPYWNYLTSNNPPWTPYYLGLTTYSQALAKMFAFDFPQWGQALAYIGHFQYGQVQADIKQVYSQTSQAQVYVGHMQTGLAIAQIGYNVLGYRKSVLADKPILYYPLDESYYGGTVSYSAYNYYSGSYLPEFAADGNTNDGWASAGYTVGEWWQVSWGVPQDILTVKLTNRPNYTFGSGRILYSDGTSYNVTFPAASRGVTTYNAPATNVTWMRLISDSGGIYDCGFSEVEAFNGDATNLVRFPANPYSLTVPPETGVLHTIVGRRNAVWDANGAIFGVTGSPSNAGTAIQFNGHAPIVNGSIVVLGLRKTISLTIPGTVLGSNNFIGPAYWGVAGDVVTFNIPGAISPASYSIGTQSYTGADNQWTYYSASTHTYSFTLGSTGLHVPYLWSSNAAYTGTGTFTYTDYSDENMIPMTVGSAITVETWAKWDGTNGRMIFGFTNYDIYLNSGNLGFNESTSDPPYGTALPAANTWFHLAAVMYTGQDVSVANKIYINGVLRTPLTGNTGTGYFSQNFTIGGWNNNTGYRWLGSLDEFAIFDYELTADQILTHFQARTNLPPAQAQAYISPAFNQSHFAQTLAYIGHFQYAQTQTKINSFDYSQLGQAQVLVASQYAFLVSGNPYSAWFDNFQTSWEAYDTGWPNLPVSNYYNFSAVARFIADTSGTWNFRISVDDRAFLIISGTTVINSGITGWGGYNTGSISLVSGTEYNIAFGLTNSDLNTEYLAIQYQRPGDATWYYLTDNKAPWALKTRGRACSQASTFILRPPYRQVYGQAQVYLQPRVYGQALAQIGHLSYAQAQARVRAFGIKGYAQALAFVGHFQTGQTQAKLNAFGVKKYSQTQAWLWHPAGYGNARTRIKATYGVFGQAQFWYLPATGKGQAQASIKQTYPLMSMDTNYALTTMGAIATDSMGQITPINVIDGNDYGPAWEIFGPQAHFENDVWVQDDEWLQIDFGQNRTVNYYRIVPVRYDATVSLQYWNGAWQELIHGISFNVGIFDPIDVSKAIAGEIPLITSSRWRLLIDNLGTNNGVSVLSFELGFATVKSGTFAQAQASFGHFAIGQARAFLWPAFGLTTFGQAKASIINTYRIYSQASVWVIPPTAIGFALADVLRTFNVYSQANTWVISPTVIATAQAKIIAYNVPKLAQARARILHTYVKTGYAKVWITKPQWAGQALATVLDRRHGKSYGQSKVYIGHFQFASTQAYITKNWKWAQAKALIRRVDIQRYAQARVVIYPWPSSLVQADIKQTYTAVGGAVGALLNTGLETAYVQADIMHTYYPVGNSKARIKQVYSPTSQALAALFESHQGQAQAKAWISKQYKVTGQAMVWINYHKFSQAQARIIAFNVPKFGLAVGYILPGNTVPGPSSDYQTYLVRFNGRDLPGYAQSESYSNELGLIPYPVAYTDGSISADIGLSNIGITIEMLVWESTYEACKDKVRLAATIMRTARGFAPLYIQHRDKYYLAIAKSLTVSKQASETPTILKYTLTFEAKPNKISS